MKSNLFCLTTTVQKGNQFCSMLGELVAPLLSFLHMSLKLRAGTLGTTATSVPGTSLQGSFAGRQAQQT